jgi:hypothetical protein
MSDEAPSPLRDVAKGLGLLFRAARTAAKKWPTKELEDVVVTSAREVGRAFENVATTLEREVLGKGRSRSAAPQPPQELKANGEKTDAPPSSEDKPGPPSAA